MEEVVAEELRHPSIRAKGIDFIPMKAGVDFGCAPANMAQPLFQMSSGHVQNDSSFCGRHFQQATLACRGTSMHAAYAACVRLRAALRVLHLLSVQYMNPHGQGYQELYGAIRRAAPWHEMIRPGMDVGVELRLRSCSDWNHSTAAQRCVHDAIADAVTDAGYAAAASLMYVQMIPCRTHPE